jgi:HPt (histidine-containing phosphotransfer) domain-containing protein
LSHGLKGVAGTLGFLNLQKAARALEEKVSLNDLIEGDDDDIEQVLTTITNVQENLRLLLSSFSEQEQSESVSIATNEEVEKTLNKLKQLLEVDDTRANALFLKFKPILQQTLGLKMAQFKQQIESFDYQKALMTLESARYPNSH